MIITGISRTTVELLAGSYRVTVGVHIESQFIVKLEAIIHVDPCAGSRFVRMAHTFEKLAAFVLSGLLADSFIHAVAVAIKVLAAVICVVLVAVIIKSSFPPSWPTRFAIPV